MKTYTIEEQAEIGKRIAEIFMLKKSREFHGRYRTMYGTKTDVGIFNTVLSIAEKINEGNCQGLLDR